MAKTKFPDPPEHLSERGKELFSFYVGLNIRAPAQIAMFVKGLESLDTADEAGKLVREEGLTIKSERSGMSRQHPGIAIQKESLATMMKVWKSLDLNSNQIEDGLYYKPIVQQATKPELIPQSLRITSAEIQRPGTPKVNTDDSKDYGV